MADRVQLEEAILDNLAAGGGDWAAIRARFPDVSESTFWRTIRRLREAGARSLALTVSRSRADTPEAGADSARTSADRVLAAAGIDAPSKVAGVRDLRLLDRIQQSFNDIDRLRRFASKPDGEVRNPAVTVQVVALQDRVTNTALRVAEMALDLQYQADFYDAVTAELVVVDKDLARRVIERLHRLNGGHETAA